MFRAHEGVWSRGCWCCSARASWRLHVATRLHCLHMARFWRQDWRVDFGISQLRHVYTIYCYTTSCRWAWHAFREWITIRHCASPRIPIRLCGLRSEAQLVEHPLGQAKRLRGGGVGGRRSAAGLDGKREGQREGDREREREREREGGSETARRRENGRTRDVQTDA